jgi:probable phosphoglycerate mutase
VTLVLVRHGRTSWNAARRLSGRTDVELDEVGRGQARRAASVLGEVRELRTSPLRRCTETAALLATGRTAVLDDRFVELDYGDAEGLALDAVDPARWQAVRHDPATRWPGGESLLDVQHRVEGACAALFARAGEGARADDGDVVVVSHVSPIKAAVAWALGTDAGLAMRLRLDTGSVTTIGWLGEGPGLLAYNVVPR